MSSITKVSALLGTALGGIVMAQAVYAGMGCDKTAKMVEVNPGGYSPAVYQVAPGAGSPAYAPAYHQYTPVGYPAARSYRMGMGGGGDEAGYAAEAPQADIVDTAIAAGSFDTLVTAVTAAGLAETLKGQGPFTVFAPTDDAFAKIPPAQLQALLDDKAALTKVLTYHVVAGEVVAADVIKLTTAATVEGQSLTIKVGESVMVDNATVIKTDIMTSNGVIHVIDTVMLPPDMQARL
jgi:uncharacterized surface protein with fasciclin (FAS1) repeats